MGLLYGVLLVAVLSRHSWCSDDDIKMGGASSYPITASWFKDRFSFQEWNETLGKFSSIGGDTVVLRAPAMVIRSADDIRKDPDFEFCGSSQSASGMGPPDCVTETQQDLSKLGLNITAYATYKYEEDFNAHIIQCPNYEKRINSSRIYHRLVIPVDAESKTMCNLPAGTKVVVVFTEFAGIDPHKLLVQSAQIHKMDVYFGLPAVPKTVSGEIDTENIQAYYSFVERILTEHSYRYNFSQTDRQLDKFDIVPEQTGIRSRSVHMSQRPTHSHKVAKDAVVGYYGRDETCLASIQQTKQPNTMLAMYSILGKMVHSFKKKFMLSPYIDLNKSQANYSLSQHVQGFELLGETKVVDVIAVQEGRGRGKGCYYFETETDQSISAVDPGLLKIVQYLDPSVTDNVTYSEQFTGSNNQLFQMFSDARDKINKLGFVFEFWLNVDAFEFLRDDPCLPVDSKGSAMNELIQRTSKSRIDWALSVAGIYVNKVISFAWDSDFTCTSSQYSQSLADDIRTDADRPIIMNCSWHSPQNMSIVIIGHGILSELTQAFQVEYQTREGATQHADQVYPYYVEGDWGIDHHRLPSLVYTQFFDLPDPFDVSLNGTVTVTSTNCYHKCVFTYDFRS